MYRNNLLPGKIHYNFTLHQGGLGDFLACLPAIKYVLTHHKHIIPHLWCHDYAVPIAKKVFAGDTIIIRGLSDYKGKYKNELPARSPYAHKISNLASNMVDHAFYTMVHTTVSNEHKNYLQMEPIDIKSFNLPEKYVVFTTGFTSPVREWKPTSINETAEYCVSKGYTPVFIGKGYTSAFLNTGIKGNFQADYSKGINLIDKTDLFQAHAIMANSQAVLGLDNGLMHLAGMSKAKCIWGFTTVLPEHRLPYKDGIQGKDCLVVMPTKQELGCIGCQSQMNFAPTTHNFTGCFYKDMACLNLMSSDKWIVKLQELGV